MKLSRDFLSAALPNAFVMVGEKVFAAGDFDQEKNMLVSIDSRTLLPGEFFIPLKGPNFDGHHFIEDALHKGASGTLVDKNQRSLIEKIDPALRAGKLFVFVQDTLDAFIMLSKTWRARLTCPVIGITGSVGKTSTKEMLSSILQAAGVDAYVSFKNYNNIFGICYNLLRVPETAQAVVMEVGINEKGEMIQLADVLRPTIGVITSIGHAHLEGLGNSLHTVSQEKRQLFAFFGGQDVGIINGDQELLTDVYYNHPIAKFGFKTKNQVQARKLQVTDNNGNLSTNFIFKWYGQRAGIMINGNHQGFVQNALAASTVAYFLKISFQHVIDGIKNYKGTESRFETKKLKHGKGLLLSDCYNANPESMKAALLAFGQFKVTGPKIAVLGDMLELGDRELYWHRQMGRVLCKADDVTRLILVGQRAQEISKTAPGNVIIEYAHDWKEAGQKLQLLLDQNDTLILVKASHGIKLDLMVKEVTE